MASLDSNVFNIPDILGKLNDIVVENNPGQSLRFSEPEEKENFGPYWTSRSGLGFSKQVSDILFAKSTGAIVLGFNVKIKPEILKLAKTEKILVKNYTIIYEMIDEISDFVQGKLDALQEEIHGISKVLAKFPFDKTFVCGVKVAEGRIAKGDKVRLLRGDEVIGESHVASVRQGKNQTSKVEEGNECGVVLTPFLDFTIGDMLISHS
jgi:translation initiation factor IF-2